MIMLLRRPAQVTLTSHNRQTTAVQALDERCAKSTIFAVAHEKEWERRVRVHKQQRRPVSARCCLGRLDAGQRGEGEGGNDMRYT